MRLISLLVILVLASVSLAADPVKDRERKVRVALALATPDVDATCGKCREDVTEARKEAMRDQKPLVLFVGEPCHGLGKVAEQVGGIAAKSSAYVGDGHPSSESRVVILEPKADGSGLMIADTLPANSDRKALTAAVEKAKPVKPKEVKGKLNWDF